MQQEMKYGVRVWAILACALFCAVMGAAARAEICEPFWTGGFGLPGVNASIVATTVFDPDGDGPAPPSLVVAGYFTSAGGVPFRRIAIWDGATWSPLGAGIGFASGTGIPSQPVFALAVFDDGAGPAIYAGGSLTVADGVSVNNIAKWNGMTWSPLGSGVDGTVLALTVFDDGSGAGPALYVGGEFASAGGMAANNIAKWDGSNWSTLESGVDAAVHALTVFDEGLGAGPVLYACGAFTSSGDVSVNHIAKWDGANWSPLGSGMNDEVRAMAIFDDGSGAGPALYAGGDFETAGGVTVNRIAKWNGATWSPLGGGVDGAALALTVFDDGSGPALYAGGFFTAAGGAPTNHIAKWDGANWSPVGSGMGGQFAQVLTLTVFDDGSSSGPALYAGGFFATAGGVTVNSITRWDGADWSSLGKGMTGNILALTIFDDGSGSGPSLYAGGAFGTAGGTPANLIAKWDGANWSPVGSGMSGQFAQVVTLTVFDDGSGSGPALYAAGSFTIAGGKPANRIAKWDGANWSPLGSGMNGSVLALTVFDDGSGTALYAAGLFTTAGGEPANRIAKWDGANWSPLGSGLPLEPRALAVFDDGSGPALYVASYIINAEGFAVNGVGKWDGANWSLLGLGMNGPVNALAVFDDGLGGGAALYAGGRFDTAGGLPANRIAKWNGGFWSPLGNGIGSFGQRVSTLTVFDDGSYAGSALYAGGFFNSAGGVPANRIAKWNGRVWSPLGSGIGGQSGRVETMTGFDDGSGDAMALYVTGSFETAGGLQATRIARWQACPPSPPGSVDLNGDGVVDAQDLSIILRSWGVCRPPPTRCPPDINGDGVVDVQDLSALLSSWGVAK